jgi:drug/metabolite transporter (DMT)-like permease
MKPLYLLELVLLSALWGASFLFMRIGVPEFGPIALISLRTGIAAIFLLPMVLVSGKWGQIRENICKLLIVGVIGTAIPFCLLSYATLYVTAGYASILNSTATIFTAIIAWVWVRESLSRAGIAGLLLGFAGVIVLVFDHQGNTSAIAVLPVGAGLLATFCYGLGANFAKQKLAHIHPLAIAGGSQLGAATSLIPLAFWLWPAQMPGEQAWLAVSLLGVACTGGALILYFRLIAHVGVNKAMSVTYLIPFFGVLWGMILLNEPLTLPMLIGGLMILAGVGLSTGVFNRLRKGRME